MNSLWAFFVVVPVFTPSPFLSSNDYTKYHFIVGRMSYFQGDDTAVNDSHDKIRNI